MLGVLIALCLFSVFVSALYGVAVQLKVSSKQRLAILKSGILLLGLMPVVVVFMFSTAHGRAIGSLLPTSQILSHAFKARSALASGGDWDWADYACAVYVFLASLALIRLVIDYLRMKSYLDACETRVMNGIRFCIGDLASSPFSFGLRYPRIFVPSNFLRTQAVDGVRVMLIHEATHIQSRDPQWKILAQLVKALLIWTPGALYLCTKFDLEMEFECDRKTIEQTRARIEDYGHLLIESAIVGRSKSNAMLSYMSQTNLSRRVKAMTAKTYVRPLVTALILVATHAAGFCAIAAVSGVGKMKGHYRVTADLLLNGKIVSHPQFVTVADDSASLEMKSDQPVAALRMMMTASDAKNSETPDGIRLKMAVEYKTENRAFRANPQMVVVPGEPGVVTIGSDANDTLEMHVTAVRE
jgi:hypothetical protein